MTRGGLALYLPTFAQGGAERVMVNLANRFVETGRPTTLILDRATGPMRDAVASGVGIIDLQARKTALAAPTLVSALNRLAPGALLSALPHNNVSAVIAGRLCRNRPRPRIVISEHLLLDHELASRRLAGRWPLRQVIRATYPWADGAVAVSPDAAEAMAQVSGLSRDRIDVVGNPVVPGDLAARIALRPDHPWLSEAGPPVLVAAGRLVPSKDFETLIRAFGRLADTRAIRLILLGEGEERVRLEGLITALGLGDRIAVPGSVPDVLPWMAAARGVVMSSRHEGFGNVLVEAMACGTPVASTDCPGGPRWILADGALGPLTPVGDVAALADAMASILDAPIAADRLRGAAERFRIDAVAARYLDAIDRSANRQSPSTLSR